LENVDPEGGSHVTVRPGQLSVALVEKLTMAEHWPGGALVTMSAGQLKRGNSIFLTTIWKVQVPTLPTPSRAMHATVCVPLSNREPEGGEQVSWTTPEQSSLAVTLNATAAEHWPGSVLIIRPFPPGQVSVGGVASTTLIVKAQLVELPPPSVTVQFTEVVPLGNTDPDDGWQTTTNVPPACWQLSVASG